MDTGGRVLVVDDNEMNRDMLSRRLSRRGFEVTVCADGASALERIEQGGLDAVVLDIMMPGIDGLEVLRRVRATRTREQLPIIMATAKDRPEDLVAALEAGANDYVTKPLEFSVVVARVTTHIMLKRSVDRVVRLQREQEALASRMRRDLEAAARLQHALLPATLPEPLGLRFAYRYEPCEELGGDIVGVHAISDTHVVLYVIDVSGHGVAASLLSVTLTRMLTPVAGGDSMVARLDAHGRPSPVPPAQVARELNHRFPMDSRAPQYFTMLYGVLDVPQRTLRYVCAAHPGPVVQEAGSAARQLEHPAFAIGWMDDAEYEEHTLRIAPGTRVLWVSDGIVEAMDASRRQWGGQRLLECFGSAREDSLESTLARLVEGGRAWTGGSYQDDVSLLAIEGVE